MIEYLNTDLDLVPAGDPTSLDAGLGSLVGLHALHSERHEDGLWYAPLETDDSYGEPEHNIAVLLAAIK